MCSFPDVNLTFKLFEHYWPTLFTLLQAWSGNKDVVQVMGHRHLTTVLDFAIMPLLVVHASEKDMVADDPLSLFLPSLALRLMVQFQV